MTKGLVDAGDWAGGLGCLGDMVRWWEKYGVPEDQTTMINGDAEPPPSLTLPLSTLPALSQLPSAFSDLTTNIAAQLEAALSSQLLSALARADVGADFNRSEFWTSVEPMLAGLVRCGKTDGVEEVWREVMSTSIREGSRKVNSGCTTAAL